MTIKNTIADRDLEALQGGYRGPGFRRGPGRLRPGAPGMEPGRGPAALFVVEAESAAAVSQAVRFAPARAMRIAPQGTSHGAAPLEPLDAGRAL